MISSHYRLYKWCAITKTKVHFCRTPFLFSPSLAVSCRKQDGGQADIEACLKFASSMPSLTQPCQVPCQEDCQLSSWSKFSSCTADCVGVRTRKRMLVGEWPTSRNFSASSADVKTFLCVKVTTLVEIFH